MDSIYSTIDKGVTNFILCRKINFLVLQEIKSLLLYGLKYYPIHQNKLNHILILTFITVIRDGLIIVNINISRQNLISKPYKATRSRRYNRLILPSQPLILLKSLLMRIIEVFARF